MDKTKEEKERKKDACKRVDDPLSTSFILEAANAEAKEFIRIVVPERDRERLRTRERRSWHSRQILGSKPFPHF